MKLIESKLAPGDIIKPVCSDGAFFLVVSIQEEEGGFYAVDITSDDKDELFFSYSDVDSVDSSLKIAELTGKRHADVMRDIKSLVSQEAINELSHKLVNYKDAKGEFRPMYNLDYVSAQFILNKYSSRANRVPSAGVYIIECQGFYKIGTASDITKRVETLQCGNPFTLNIVLFCSVDKAKKLECRLHKDYSSKKVHGEWFSLSKKEVSRAIGIIKNQDGK